MTRTTWIALLAVVVLAALLRFPTLDVQSYWFDEAATAGKVIQPSLIDTLHNVNTSEATPPLYYGVAWFWSKLFGTGEVGLRSLSALVGTLTVLVAYAAATRLSSPRAGLLAALLVATSPLLVWFSQEARAYALVVFLGALSFLFFIRALQGGRDRDYWLWALFSAAAIATHYFAAFPVIAEAAWLVLRGRRGGIAVAAGSVIALTSVALLPLALGQADHRVGWITDIPMLERIRVVAKMFAGGPGFHLSWQPEIGPGFVAVLALLIIVCAGLYLAWRADPAERRRAALPAGIGGAALGLPIVAAAVGPDYFLHRNVIVAWVPLIVAFGVLCAARRAPVAGLLAASVLAALFTFLSLGQALDSSRQRDNWREAAEVLGPASPARAIVTAPNYNRLPIQFYRPWIRPMNTGPRRVEEIVIMTVTPNGLSPPPKAPHGFRYGEHRAVEANEVLTMITLQPRAARRLDAQAIEEVAHRMGFRSVSALIDSPRA